MSDEIDEAIEKVAENGGADPANVPEPDAAPDTEPAGELAEGEPAPEPEEPSTLKQLFAEPADLRPQDVDRHTLVELVRDGITTLADDPREALAYLVKAGIVTLDKIGLPVGGKRPLPAIVYVLIGIVAVIVSLITGGGSDEPDGGDAAADREVVLEETESDQLEGSD